MGDNITEEGNIQEIINGIGFTKDTTLMQFITSIFEVGRAVGVKEGYESRKHDEAEEADLAYERGQLDG